MVSGIRLGLANSCIAKGVPCQQCEEDGEVAGFSSNYRLQGGRIAGALTLVVAVVQCLRRHSSVKAASCR